MFAKRSLTKTLRTYRATLQDVSKSTSQISDIWCAEIMQSDRMRRLFGGNSDNERAIALQFALDGVQTHKLGSNNV